MRVSPLAWIALASAAGFAAARFGPQDPNKAPPVVRASRFELVDGEGRIRAVLGVSKTGNPEFDLRDAIGRPRALLVLDKDSLPILLLKDEAVVTRARVELDAKGAAKLTFGDADLTPRLELDGAKPGLQVSNPKGESIWKVP